MSAKSESLAGLLAELRALQAKRDAVLEATAPLHAEVDALQAQIDPLRQRLREAQDAVRRAEVEADLEGITRRIADLANAQMAFRATMTADEIAQAVLKR